MTNNGVKKNEVKRQNEKKRGVSLLLAIAMVLTVICSTFVQKVLQIMLQQLTAH